MEVEFGVKYTKVRQPRYSTGSYPPYWAGYATVTPNPGSCVKFRVMSTMNLRFVQPAQARNRSDWFTQLLRG